MKRLFDILVSILFLVFFAPIMIVACTWIFAETGRPIFFRQERIGLGGKPFWMYKFRSMIKDAEKQEEGLFVYSDDKRITRPGTVLRALSIDELPQIINVIKGDMSIVGPRPPVIYELGNYEQFPEKLKGRFVVKPGLTGLAQVSGRNSLDWDRKLEFDLEYIERYRKWGLIEDLRIILITPFVIFGMKNINEVKKNI